ncbi:hypothetical protein D3C84_1195090 [compost metagenome]
MYHERFVLNGVGTATILVRKPSPTDQPELVGVSIAAVGMMGICCPRSRSG